MSINLHNLISKHEHLASSFISGNDMRKNLLAYHPGLSNIPARVGGPGSDTINLGITIGGQKLGAGRFLIPGAGRGLTCCLPKFASAF